MGEKKPVFVTDVDSVLLDISTPIDRAVGEMYPGEKPFGWMRQWTTIWDLSIGLGIPEKKMPEVWARAFSKPNKPYPGAIRFVRKLKALGFEVIGVSKRSEPLFVQAAERDFPTLELDRWILVDGPKGPVVEDLEAYYMVDDKIGNLMSVQEHSPDTSLVLFDRPWNLSADVEVPYWRMETYDDILELVREDLKVGLEPRRSVIVPGRVVNA